MRVWSAGVSRSSRVGPAPWPRRSADGGRAEGGDRHSFSGRRGEGGDRHSVFCGVLWRGRSMAGRHTTTPCTQEPLYAVRSPQAVGGDVRAEDTGRRRGQAFCAVLWCCAVVFCGVVDRWQGGTQRRRAPRSHCTQPTRVAYAPHHCRPSGSFRVTEDRIVRGVPYQAVTPFLCYALNKFGRKKTISALRNCVRWLEND